MATALHHLLNCIVQKDFFWDLDQSSQDNLDNPYGHYILLFLYYKHYS